MINEDGKFEVSIVIEDKYHSHCCGRDRWIFRKHWKGHTTPKRTRHGWAIWNKINRRKGR